MFGLDPELPKDNITLCWDEAQTPQDYKVTREQSEAGQDRRFWLSGLNKGENQLIIKPLPAVLYFFRVDLDPEIP